MAWIKQLSDLGEEQLDEAEKSSFYEADKHAC